MWASLIGYMANVDKVGWARAQAAGMGTGEGASGPGSGRLSRLARAQTE